MAVVRPAATATPTMIAIRSVETTLWRAVRLATPARNAMMAMPALRMSLVVALLSVMWNVYFFQSLPVFQEMGVVHLHAMPTTTMIAPQRAEMM
jgi:hypothetical protein